MNADLYLLEVARHALLAPVRAGLVRRAIDWPHSSARESCGLCPAPAWLDPTPLYDLLGPQDGQGSHAFSPLHRERLARAQRFGDQRRRRDAAVHALGERVPPGTRPGLPVEEPEHVARDGAQRRAGRHP